MARYVARVPLRWTDQDSFHHVNHARAVTLLEEARIGLLFDEASAAGVTGFAAGVVVAGLEVDYRRQIPYRSHALRVCMWVHQVRAASFLIDYELHDGPDESDAVAVGARTRMALFDLAAQRPRRITAEERAFLDRWGEA
ncbi:acyl-CoA thioesterase [Pseudonocardia hispaniensis]|uniref:Acyl-CoA thioesterase n=1 Tax=Pseudonocardia hispaniensis TaxID=904933 RepID=A0ABW1J3F0_9PSEU